MVTAAIVHRNLCSKVRRVKAIQPIVHHSPETGGTCRRRNSTFLRDKGQSESGHRPQCGQLYCSAFRWRF
ncbi:hypothetical protein EMEDMD4_570229 [Sinorhizobium medicae]|uniref:Uncharacterized protein n=1 Tax=Sinorhizobium medicae TaxID=110321 RepID=A0A508X3M5_9HYPH|nr:hypothetical protein EMEDMD4_570229 [Sinorhizobium medicae]